MNEIATCGRASFWSCIPYIKARSPNTSCDGARCYCDITAISTYIPDALLMRSYRSYPRIMTMCEGSNCQLLHINVSNVDIDGLSITVVWEHCGSYNANAILDCIFVIENCILFIKMLMTCVFWATQLTTGLYKFRFMGIICWPFETVNSFYKQSSCNPYLKIRQ